MLYWLFLFFERFYLLIFREKGREREGKGEKHQCERETIGCLLYTLQPETTCNPVVCPDRESNEEPFVLRTTPQHLSYTSQAAVLCCCFHFYSYSREKHFHYHSIPRVMLGMRWVLFFLFKSAFIECWLPFSFINRGKLMRERWQNSFAWSRFAKNKKKNGR